jgi:hypothetical protein
MIHEKSLSLSAQGMEDFNKITAEGFYRWEFAPRQKLSVRLFAGYFLEMTPEMIYSTMEFQEYPTIHFPITF